MTDPLMPYMEQLDSVVRAVDGIACPLFIRFFLSDAATQTPALKERLHWNCAVSIIGQAPLDGTKIAAWVWSDPSAVVSLEDGLYKVRSGDACMCWCAGCLSGGDGPEEQTVSLLDGFSSRLERCGMTLQDNCVRTWFYVQNIDVNYQGMVRGRNSVFDAHGLTAGSHFIASTGIEGRTADHRNTVAMDALAVSGMDVSYLYALSHMNRTSDYGVRFERGAVVGNMVFISGTASIDSRGNVMHPGDIVGQTDRMLENVGVLLSEAGCTFRDVLSVLVYLRDPADYRTVRRIFDSRFPGLQYIILHAPVCRPGWLVEMECVAEIS